MITSYGRSNIPPQTSDGFKPANNLSFNATATVTAPSAAEVVDNRTNFRLAQYRPNPRARTGGNSRAFHDPLTLQQALPSLRDAPGGSIIAVADSFFNLTGPANAATETLTTAYTRKLLQDIKEIDPGYAFETLGQPQTLQGQLNQINSLRLDRAAARYRIRGETAELQVETLRFLQKSVDQAYIEGLQRLETGKLPIRLSSREALGNHIDRTVRRDLRRLYDRLEISTGRDQKVRVIGREYDSSGNDRTFRIPDARVGNVAFDFTLTAKTISTRQVRGFFNSDFRPEVVVIVRPRQLGAGSTYVIKRPRT